MDIGLQWAGFNHRFFAEIDEYCRAVLAARFPGVTIYDDVRAVDADAGYVDLLCGGFPCQDLSVAGKRAGLAGDRSGLFFEFMRIVDALRPRAIVIENVEGLYSSGSPKGADFGVVLDSLAERGYLASWRTLDAQHFGVPQRRRRVFVCAIADGDPRAERIGEVLAVAEGGERDLATSDSSWPFSASTVGGGADRSSGRVVGALTGRNVTRLDDQCVGGGHIVPAITRKWAKGSGGPAGDEHQNLVWTGVGVNPSNTNVAGTLPSNQQGGQRTTDIAGAYVYRKSRRAKSDEDFETWTDDGVSNTLNQFDASSTRTTHAVVSVGGEIAHTLTKEGHDASEDGTGRGTTVITYNVRPEDGNGADLRVDEDEIHPTLAQQTHLPGYDRVVRVQEQATVRRLTPMECERLMGWPDGWTDIPWNKKDHSPDSRRYAACGNGVVAPVAYWIGARLAEVLHG